MTTPTGAPINWQPTPHLPPSSPRRWPAFLGGAVIGAIGAAVITAATLIRVDTVGPRKAPTIATSTPMIATSAPTTAVPAPLSMAEANRRTCNAWLAAGGKIHDATAALATIPPDATILDRVVQDNADLIAAVKRPASAYKEAGDELVTDTGLGADLMLAQASATAAAALHTLSTAYGTADAASGNAYAVMRETADTMDALCNRLAPR